MLSLLRLRQNLLMQQLLEPPVWRPDFPLATVYFVYHHQMFFRTDTRYLQ